MMEEGPECSTPCFPYEGAFLFWAPGGVEAFGACHVTVTRAVLAAPTHGWCCCFHSLPVAGLGGTSRQHNALHERHIKRPYSMCFVQWRRLVRPSVSKEKRKRRKRKGLLHFTNPPKYIGMYSGTLQLPEDDVPPRLPLPYVRDIGWSSFGWAWQWLWPSANWIRNVCLGYSLSSILRRPHELLLFQLWVGASTAVDNNTSLGHVEPDRSISCSSSWCSSAISCRFEISRVLRPSWLCWRRHWRCRPSWCRGG